MMVTPFHEPLRFARGEARPPSMSSSVHTDGLVGTAEAPPRPFTYGETQVSITRVIDGIISPQVLGLSPSERETMHARLSRTVGNPTAKSAIDMAVWDLIGPSLGVSVTDLLGGFTDRMRVAHMVLIAAAGC